MSARNYLFVSLWLVSSSASASPLYHVTDLDVLPGSSSSIANDINNAGWIVGYSYLGAEYSDTARGFLFKDGGMMNIGTLGGRTVATSINESGQITGYSKTGSVERGFLSSNGMMTDIGTLPGGMYSAGQAINNSGQIVGIADVNDLDNHAMMYDGAMHDLGTLPLDPHVQVIAFANGINDSGIIVGNSNGGSGGPFAFVYDGTAMQNLGTLGGNTSGASAINNSGVIVGNSWISLSSGVSHAYVYSNGVMTDLGALGIRNFSDAHAINNNGQIVGIAYKSTGSDSGHSFLVDNGVMLDLNDMLDASGAGWTLVSANDINDNGWIVGYGTNPAGQTHAYLLVPVPEPGAFGLMAWGFLGLLTMMRSRRLVGGT